MIRVGRALGHPPFDEPPTTKLTDPPVLRHAETVVLVGVPLLLVPPKVGLLVFRLALLTTDVHEPTVGEQAAFRGGFLPLPLGGAGNCRGRAGCGGGRGSGGRAGRLAPSAKAPATSGRSAGAAFAWRLVSFFFALLGFGLLALALTALRRRTARTKGSQCRRSRLIDLAEVIGAGHQLGRRGEVVPHVRLAMRVDVLPVTLQAEHRPRQVPAVAGAPEVQLRA